MAKEIHVLPERKAYVLELRCKREGQRILPAASNSLQLKITLTSKQTISEWHISISLSVLPHIDSITSFFCSQSPGLNLLLWILAIFYVL